MTEYFNEIASGTLLIVRAIIGLVFTAVVIPWLKKIVIPWLKEKRLYGIVSHFVQAAEKLAESGAIDKSVKKDYVIRLLTAKGIYITNEIEAYIESAVEELDLAIDSGLIDVVHEFYEVEDYEETDEETENTAD